MIRFHDYYGNEVYIVPARVLFVRDGCFGSRGTVAEVHLDNGKIISLGDTAERVQRVIAEALNG